MGCHIWPPSRPHCYDGWSLVHSQLQSSKDSLSGWAQPLKDWTLAAPSSIENLEPLPFCPAVPSPCPLLGQISAMPESMRS